MVAMKATVCPAQGRGGFPTFSNPESCPPVNKVTLRVRTLQEGPEAAVPWSVPRTRGERGAGSRLRAWRAPSLPGRLQNCLPAAPPADHTPHYPVPLSRAGFLEKCLRVFVCTCVCRHVFVSVFVCACAHAHLCMCSRVRGTWVCMYIHSHRSVLGVFLHCSPQFCFYFKSCACVCVCACVYVTLSLMALNSTAQKENTE